MHFRCLTNASRARGDADLRDPAADPRVVLHGGEEEGEVHRRQGDEALEVVEPAPPLFEPFF